MSSLRVFMYHKISQDKSDYLTVKVSDFEQQMNFIQSRFNVVTLKDVVQSLQNGNPLPPRAALITFDDGYLNNYELAYPVLKKLGMSFTIFLVGRYVGMTIEHDGIEQAFLSKEHIQDMSDFGSFAYHGLGHENIMNLDESLWETYVESTIKHFETLNIKMEPCWAYTYGAFPRKSKEKMKKLVDIFSQMGIVCAFRIGNRINSWPVRQVYKIQRMDVRGNQSYWKFKLKSWLGKISI